MLNNKLNILWITNIIFPSLSKELSIKPPVTGAWLYSAAYALLEYNSGYNLAIATTYSGSKFLSLKIENITYFLLPQKFNNTKYQPSLEKYWKKVDELFIPDIAHIHGTELAHGLAFLNACPKVKSVVTVQGLVSIIERYYYADIEFCDIVKNITFRDIFRRDTLFHQRIKFIKRGKIEKEIINKVAHVIGRTSWDKSHVFTINPNVTYHLCNETIRNSFYNNKWKFENCEKFSILLSQANYPIKGLHQVLKALSIVIKTFPQTHLYIAGINITAYYSFTDKIKISGYGMYIRKLITKLDLQKNITFTNILDEKGMIERYLQSNVFICPSSIENSPNSLCEAQLLGVPIIASYVGGIPDLIENGKTGYLYRFEEWEMLAENIKDVFINTPQFETPNIAKERHNAKKNANQLSNIYNIINSH